VARIGGDEFAVVSINSNKDMLDQSCHMFKEKINSYNKLNPGSMLNISVGFAVQNGNSIEEVFKQADNNMYREKLHRSHSVRSYMVKTLLKALEERDIITEQHTERLCWLVGKFALDLGLTEPAINELNLFARFHDIGKVGIADSILFKPGPLSPQERLDMQMHCEIGQRIALSSPDLIPISDWIFKHHEWWNGQGYPLGISRKEIPFECRLLKIVDSYDAMTNDRPYRKAVSHEQAVFELRRCSGVQTDPYLTEKFLITIEDIRKGYTVLV
jgi:HD-GYP domain-containing protein (c-di-GMP phosphodiesterase class II)